MLGNLKPTDAIGLSPPAKKPPPAASRPIVVVDEKGLFKAVSYLPYKRVLDIVLAVAFAIVLAPILLLTFIIVKITSPGPFFYKQIRLGRLGKPFVIWKVRTMRHNVEAVSGAIWSTKGDSRITPVGKVLRKLHIDEFPQLWNVLKGDMSLVGPRPERPEFFPILEASIPDYSMRLLVKPGVTGLAQSYLPPDEDIQSVRLKQTHDIYYVENMSIWLDLRLIMITALQVVGVPHVVARTGLVLPHPRRIIRPEELEGPVLAKTPVPN